MTLDPQSENPVTSVPSEATSEVAKPARSPAAIRRTRERIVLLSMGLVTAATAASLYVVYELSMASAVLAACGVWAALMTIHLQLKKDGEIKRLKGELHRLERHAAGQGPVADHNPHAIRPAMLPAASQTMPMSARSPAPASAASEAASAHRAAIREPAPLPDIDAQIPPGEDGDAMLAPATLRLDPSPRWVGPSQHARTPKAVPTPAGTMPPLAAKPAGPTDVPLTDETALWPGTEISPSDPMRDQWAFRPREDIEGPAASGAPTPVSIEADLEMVQRKIKALADEVNAADAVRERNAKASDAKVDDKAKGGEAARPPVTGQDSQARPNASIIEQSIGALKSTARSMRTKPAPRMPGQASSDQASTARAQTSEAPRQDDVPSEAASGQPLPLDLLIPKTAQTIAASKPEAVRNQAPPPPVLELPPLPDLDAPPKPLVDPRIAAIAQALNDSEMDVFLSPIVALQNHEVSHYDVTVRLKSRTGGYLDEAEQELRLAGSDLLALFDTARLTRAAALARRLESHKKKGSLLSAVNGRSMTNAEFLEAFARVFEERDRISNQLVLTFTQADIEQFSPSAWQALDDMHAFGFRFALSSIDHVGMDFAALAKRGFAFLRLDAGALLNGLPAHDRFLGPDELCQHLAGAGMTLVADTIDDEAVRARIFGFGILFGQGRLFGGARQIKLDPIPSNSPAAA